MDRGHFPAFLAISHKVILTKAQPIILIYTTLILTNYEINIMSVVQESTNLGSSHIASG